MLKKLVRGRVYHDPDVRFTVTEKGRLDGASRGKKGKKRARIIIETVTK